MPNRSPDPPVPSPQGGRPTLEQAKQITARIVDAASDLFLSAGFGSTSIDQIAAAARISKRTFYTRFSSKQDLFAAVIRKKTLSVSESVKLVRGRSGTLEVHLVEIASALYKMISHPDVIAVDRLVSIEAARLGELSQALGVASNQLIAVVESAFADAHARGELVVDDAWFLADQFVNAMASGPLQKAPMGVDPPRKGAELKLHLRRSVQLFLYGCARKPPASETT